jgi:hypothetical protein
VPVLYGIQLVWAQVRLAGFRRVLLRVPDTRSRAWGKAMRTAIAPIGLSFAVVSPQSTLVWEDDGHKATSVVAERRNVPQVELRIVTTLGYDIDNGSGAPSARLVRAPNVSDLCR